MTTRAQDDGWVPASARVDKPLAQEPARPDWHAGVQEATDGADHREAAALPDFPDDAHPHEETRR